MIQNDTALIAAIRDRFAHVDSCPFQGPRIFFENAGGALTLKSVVETSSFYAALPDNPGRINPAGQATQTTIDKAKADLAIFMISRGSCRSFQDREVNPELSRLLCAAALASPTKSDLQQRDIILVRDPAVKDRLLELAGSEGWTRKTPNVAVFCGNNLRQRQLHEESYEQWATWFKKAGLAINHSLTGPRLWDANLGFDAALAGQGIALTSNLLAARELEDGRLVELFETDIRVGGYFLLKRSSSAADEQLQRFQLWIERLIREAE